MTPEIVAVLHPPRLPGDFAAAGWADLLAAFGLGLLLAAGIAALLGPALRPRPARPTAAAEIARLRALPSQDRLLGLLRLAASRGVALPADLRAQIYGPTPPDPRRIEALLRGEGMGGGGGGGA